MQKVTIMFSNNFFIIFLNVTFVFSSCQELEVEEIAKDQYLLHAFFIMKNSVLHNLIARIKFMFIYFLFR